MVQAFHKIQWLTIAELAEAWAPELTPLPKAVIQRELQMGLYKLHNEMDLREPLKDPPPFADLPSQDTLISRDFVERFCTESEELSLPSFWFDMKAKQKSPSFPGRPSIMRAIVQELEVRAESGNLAVTLAEQSRQLEEWAATNLKGQHIPTAKTIESGVRLAYAAFKRGAKRPL